VYDVYMDLRINKIEPSLMNVLKKRAIDAGKTLRQYIIDLLNDHVQGKRKQS